MNRGLISEPIDTYQLATIKIIQCNSDYFSYLKWFCLAEFIREFTKMENPPLPKEILIEIFSRLPAKSVGKCKCLSKLWRTYLSTSQFINLHLTRKNHQENLIVITPFHSLHTITPPIKDDAGSRNLELPNTWTEVVGSCNGLVLLLNEEDELYLVNPTTTQQVRIPDSDLALKKNESFRMHGFGYDSFSDDYKIVTLSYYNTDNEYEPDCVDTFVDVYSVKRGVWKRVNSSIYDHAVPEISPGAFVNGAIHWLASSRESGYPSAIAAYDFVDEVFREIPAPPSLDVTRFVFNRLYVLEGCLCMVDSLSNNSNDVWMMKEYGLVQSWTKFSIVANDEWDRVKPLCFIGEQELLLATDADNLVVYNLKEGTFNMMVVHGVVGDLIDASTFVDSLVSLSQHAFSR